MVWVWFLTMTSIVNVYLACTNVGPLPLGIYSSRKPAAEGGGGNKNHTSMKFGEIN